MVFVENLLIQNCYIDESYDEKTFVLSCTVADASRWALFEEAWRGVLDAVNEKLLNQGRKEISRYHATYCAGMSGEFQGWSVDEQIDLTANLIAAVKMVPMHSVAHTVFLKDVRESFEARFRVPMARDHLLKAAYFLAMEHCMLTLGSYLYWLNPFQRIAFIHDHSGYDSTMLQAFNHVKYNLNLSYANLFSTIEPASSKECIPLQLADFFAYEFFKDRGGEETKGGLYRRRRSLSLTLQTGTGVSLRTITREWIEMVLGHNADTLTNQR
jgi:Protein of unknown function (DUF3800)